MNLTLNCYFRTIKFEPVKHISWIYSSFYAPYHKSSYNLIQKTRSSNVTIIQITTPNGTVKNRQISQIQINWSATVNSQIKQRHSSLFNLRSNRRSLKIFWCDPLVLSLHLGSNNIPIHSHIHIFTTSQDHFSAAISQKHFVWPIPIVCNIRKLVQWQIP